MGTMDWKTILSFNHEDIADEDKEKIYDSIVGIETLDIDISFSELKNLFIITQEILKHKGYQVTSLTSELDDMATKQGQLEAESQLNISKADHSGLQQLKEQLEEKEIVIESNNDEIEKLKQKITTLEEQIEEMIRERDDDRSSTPDPISQLDRIKELGDSLKKKNENIKELFGDLQVVNEENQVIRDKLNHTKEKLAEATADIQNLSALVTNSQGENKHLNEVIEELERTNTSLKAQVKEIIQINMDQDAQLDEFAKQMDDRIADWKDILNEKNMELEALQKHCIQLQNLSPVIKEVQPDYYTELMKQRENQIDTLQNKLQEATNDILASAETIKKLRDDKEELLRNIEKIKMGLSLETSEELGILERMKEDTQRWKLERDDMEECLKIKEAELAQAFLVINQLEGETGDHEDNLEEKLSTVSSGRKRLRQQLRVRDEHIHRLVEENNSMRRAIDHLQLENTVMRKKLNLPPEQSISPDDILARHSARKKELANVIKKLGLCEEQKISLQIQLRQKDKCLKKLIRQVRSCGIKIPESFLAAIITDDSARQAFEKESQDLDVNLEIHSKYDVSEVDTKSNTYALRTKESPTQTKYDEEKYNLMKENYRQVVDENEGLRKGLHEIFNAIKEKATTSNCEITSVCLEKLLQALDARHLAGWYHPAMRTLLELQAEKGVQESLRIMLKEARQEILATLDLLAKESVKNKQLEETLTISESKKTISIEEPKLKSEEPKITVQPDPPQKVSVDVQTHAIEDNENITEPDFANVQSLNETYVIPNNKMYNKTLQNILKHFHTQFESLYENMIEIFNQSSAEKSKWQIKEEQYKNSIENMSINLDTLNNKLDGREKIKQAHDDEELSLAEINVAEFNTIITQKKCLERKVKYLEESQSAIYKDNQELKSELFSVKKMMLEKFKVFEVDGQKFMFHVAELKNKLRKTVPLDIFIKQNEKLNGFEMKYRKLLNHNSSFETGLSTGINVAKWTDYEKVSNELNKTKTHCRELVLKDIEKMIELSNNGGKALASSLSECKTDLVFSEQKVKYLESVNALLSDQLQNFQVKLDEINKLLSTANERVQLLEDENIKMQEREMELINKVQSSLCFDSTDVDLDVLNKLTQENEILKVENLKHTKELDLLNNQINDIQHDKLVSGLEMNILRHQILDLQSENDHKAIIARLSSEILVSHLHTAEMHRKRERLSMSLQRERERIKRLEYLLHEKEIQLDQYISRTNSKISFFSTAIQCLREQYQGSVPLAVLENIQNTRQELHNKLKQLDSKEKDDHLNSAIHKSDDQLSSSEKISGELICDDASCSHSFTLKIKESKWQREKSCLKNQIKTIEMARNKLEEKVSSLEENLLTLTFAFGKSNTSTNERIDEHKTNSDDLIRNGGGDVLITERSGIELIDIDPEDHIISSSAISEENTVKPTPKPRTFIKTSPREIKNTKLENSTVVPVLNLPGSPLKNLERNVPHPSTVTVIIQTDPVEMSIVENAICQTDEQTLVKATTHTTDGPDVEFLKAQIKKIETHLKEALDLASQRAEKILSLQTEKSTLECNLAAMKLLLEKQGRDDKTRTVVTSSDEKSDEENELEHLKKILMNLKTMENEKNALIKDYKEQLEKEKLKHDADKSMAQKQIQELKVQIDNLDAECKSLKSLLTSHHSDSLSSSLEQYRGKVLELEDRCFQMQRELENTHTNILSSKAECERWKQLAADRFTELETLSRRMEEKHGDEVKSYKIESNHWLSELEQCRNELRNSRGELNHVKCVMAREIGQKEDTIRKLHYLNGTLKQQILNLQTVISTSDPTFELTAIVESEEDNNQSVDNIGTLRAESAQYGDTMSDVTAENMDIEKNGYRIGKQWQDPGLERLRMEKQMLSKQNSLLRKQIRILAARERRIRLELHHSRSAKSKSPRITNNVMQAEEVSYLQRKIESLESELSEKHTFNYINNDARAMQIALWDKQKKWQVASERWKARFEEKSQQVERLEKSLESARNTIQRIEKDKRITDSRMSRISRTTDSIQSPPISEIDSAADNRVEMLMRDKERLEEEVKLLKMKLESGISQSSLLERVEAQQRKIVALELADKGKDVLVLEYERLLEQNSQLAKRNLKLESEILDVQLRHGIGGRDEADGENSCCRRNRLQKEHLENYVKLLKEENSQLIARNIEQPILDNTNYRTGTLAQSKRTADLERTVLTLRGLIRNLQSVNKKLVGDMAKEKKIGSSTKDKIIEELKEENSNLKQVIDEKDQLLEKARTLLNRAVERKRELQNEINMLKENK